MRLIGVETDEYWFMPLFVLGNIDSFVEVCVCHIYCSCTLIGPCVRPGQLRGSRGVWLVTPRSGRGFPLRSPPRAALACYALRPRFCSGLCAGTGFEMYTKHP